MADKTFESQQLAAERHGQANRLMSEAAGNWGAAQQRREEFQASELNDLTQSNKQIGVDRERNAVEQQRINLAAQGQRAEIGQRDRQLAQQAKEGDSRIELAKRGQEQSEQQQGWEQGFRERQQAETERAARKREEDDDYGMSLRRDEFSLAKARFQQEQQMQQHEDELQMLRIEKMRRESDARRIEIEDQKAAYEAEMLRANAQRVSVAAEMDRAELVKMQRSVAAEEAMAGSQSDVSAWIDRVQQQGLFDSPDQAKALVESKRRDAMSDSLSRYANTLARDPFSGQEMGRRAMQLAMDLMSGKITTAEAAKKFSGVMASMDAMAEGATAKEADPDVLADGIAKLSPKAQKLHEEMTAMSLPLVGTGAVNLAGWLDANEDFLLQIGRNSYTRADGSAPSKMSDEQMVEFGKRALIGGLQRGDPATMKFLLGANSPLSESEKEELLRRRASMQTALDRIRADEPSSIR